jgi:pimeloyl-ACP methyl ester carboxylesterase
VPIVTVNGIRLSYEEQGRGEPLLLLMGLGAPGSIWADHLAVYAKSFRCIIMDNRGAGESDRPTGPYTTAMMADDAAGLLEALGVTSALVAGISMGSAIAQQLALRHPAKVRRMALVSSWARCDTYMRDVFLSLARARSVFGSVDFIRLLQLWIWSPRHFNTHVEAMEEARNAHPEALMSEHAFTAQAMACATHDALGLLRRITQPCLLTVGDADIFTPLRLSQEINDVLPDSRLEVFHGLGHCHHWEDLDRFNLLTSRFLGGG